MASNGHNSATRVLGVVKETIEQNTKSGAKIEQTYGQVFGLSDNGREASVYLAGSRELATSDGGVPEPSEGFRVPAHMTLQSSDYVRVAIDQRGHRWVEEFLPSSPYSKVSIDHANGRIAFGDGTLPPTNYLSIVGGAFQQTSFSAVTAAPTDNAFTAKDDGDAGSRFLIQGNGLHAWGDGGGTTDVSMYRNGAGLLEVGGTLKATALQIGANKVGRFVAGNFGTPVTNAGTTTDVSNSTEITGIPSTGVTHVLLRLRLRNTGGTSGSTMTVQHWDGTTALQLMAPAQNRDASGQAIVTVGGVNNRQFKWLTSLGGQTNTYDIFCVGYWTTE